MKFSGICLITRDVRRLAAFYMEALGVEAELNDVHVEFDAHSTSMAIYSEDGMEEMAPRSMQGAGRGCFTINFQVESVDVEYERMRKLGVEFILLPKTHPWGARSMWFRDPDGNIVNFFCRV
jgi:catechol 2,3-dioxygenase-like lactoylglutathione lyase family enzyme